MGRPPKPTRLKVMNGSARHDPQRINRSEPQPRAGARVPPFLPRTGPARSAWNRLLPILERMRVMTEADAEALALGCLALAEYLSARNDEESWRRADAAWKRYAAMLGWFGLNPSARSKVHTTSEPEAVDPLDAWAAR